MDRAGIRTEGLNGQVVLERADSYHVLFLEMTLHSRARLKKKKRARLSLGEILVGLAGKDWMPEWIIER